MQVHISNNYNLKIHKKINIKYIKFFLIVLYIFFNCGVTYASIDFTFPENFTKEDYDLFIKLAKENDPIAINNLGVMYEKGFYVEKNPIKAKELYERSANQGYDIAMNNLGYLYLNGIGTNKNLSKAIELFERASGLGNAVAQANLGICYAGGIGVNKDYIIAKFWLNKSAEQGYVPAQEILNKLNSQYTKSNNLTNKVTQRAVTGFLKGLSLGIIALILVCIVSIFKVIFNIFKKLFKNKN